MKTFIITALLCIFSCAVAHSKLLVKLSESTITSSKAIVKLTLKNIFSENIESARATLFLLDAQGKVVGQSTAWVVGGTKDKAPLAPDATTTYNFVLSSEKSFTTTKLTFSRIILEGGKPAHPQRDFEILK